jgi:hypothetical protein
MDSFAVELAKAVAGLRVTVPDRLGGAEQRTFELSFDKLRSFWVLELLAALPELEKLQALAEGFMKADPSRPLTPEEGAARVAEVVGAGRLSSAVSLALGGRRRKLRPLPLPRTLRPPPPRAGRSSSESYSPGRRSRLPVPRPRQEWTRSYAPSRPKARARRS